MKTTTKLAALGVLSLGFSVGMLGCTEDNDKGALKNAEGGKSAPGAAPAGSRRIRTISPIRTRPKTPPSGPTTRSDPVTVRRATPSRGHQRGKIASSMPSRVFLFGSLCWIGGRIPTVPDS